MATEEADMAAVAVTVVDRVTAAVGRAAAVVREAVAATGAVQAGAVGPVSAAAQALVKAEAAKAAAPAIPAVSRSERPVSVYAGDIETIRRLEALPAFWRGRALVRRIEAELIGAGHAADVHLTKAREYDAIADKLARWR